MSVDIRALLDRYGRDGHIDAGSFEGDSGTAGWRFLKLDVTRDYLNKTVKVVYKIQQGRPFYLRFLEVAGNLNTKDRVISACSPSWRAIWDAEKVRTTCGASAERGSSTINSPAAPPAPAVNYRTVRGAGPRRHRRLGGGGANDQREPVGRRRQ